MNVSQEEIELVRAVAELAVVPLVIVLWNLNNSIRDLRTLLYREFLTIEAHYQWHENEREAASDALSNVRSPTHHPSGINH